MCDDLSGYPDKGNDIIVPPLSPRPRLKQPQSCSRRTFVEADDKDDDDDGEDDALDDALEGDGLGLDDDERACDPAALNQQAYSEATAGEIVYDFSRGGVPPQVVASSSALGPPVSPVARKVKGKWFAAVPPQHWLRLSFDTPLEQCPPGSKALHELTVVVDLQLGGSGHDEGGGGGDAAGGGGDAGGAAKAPTAPPPPPLEPFSLLQLSARAFPERATSAAATGGGGGGSGSAAAAAALVRALDLVIVEADGSVRIDHPWGDSLRSSRGLITRRRLHRVVVAISKAQRRIDVLVDAKLAVSLNDDTARDAAQALGRTSAAEPFVSAAPGGLLLFAGRSKTTTPGEMLVRYVCVARQYLSPDEVRAQRQKGRSTLGDAGDERRAALQQRRMQRQLALSSISRTRTYAWRHPAFIAEFADAFAEEPLAEAETNAILPDVP